MNDMPCMADEPDEPDGPDCQGCQGVRVTRAAWPIVLAMLSGNPLPALPKIPGRLIAVSDPPLTADEREDLLRSDATDSEAAAILGVTRQRVYQLRQALRERAATTEGPTK